MIFIYFFDWLSFIYLFFLSQSPSSSLYTFYVSLDTAKVFLIYLDLVETCIFLYQTTLLRLLTFLLLSVAVILVFLLFWVYLSLWVSAAYASAAAHSNHFHL